MLHAGKRAKGEELLIIRTYCAWKIGTTLRMGRLGPLSKLYRLRLGN